MGAILFSVHITTPDVVAATGVTGLTRRASVFCRPPIDEAEDRLELTLRTFLRVLIVRRSTGGQRSYYGNPEDWQYTEQGKSSNNTLPKVLSKRLSGFQTFTTFTKSVWIFEIFFFPFHSNCKLSSKEIALLPREFSPSNWQIRQIHSRKIVSSLHPPPIIGKEEGSARKSSLSASPLPVGVSTLKEATFPELPSLPVIVPLSQSSEVGGDRRTKKEDQFTTL